VAPLGVSPRAMEAAAEREGASKVRREAEAAAPAEQAASAAAERGLAEDGPAGLTTT